MWATLLPHQKSAVRYLLDHKQCMLFSKPGTGKTLIALSVMKITRSKSLIIAPLPTVLATWPGELRKWVQFKPLDWGIAHGKTRESAFGHDITIINPAGLAWLDSHQDLLVGKTALYLDEITMFKVWGTKRTKYLKRIVDRFSRRHGLTGTPVPNSVLDWFSEQYMIDSGASFGKYKTAFARKYFYPCGFKNRDWRPFENTYKIMSTLAFGRYFVAENKKLNIPGTHFIDIDIVMPDSARKIYKSMEQRLVADVAGTKRVSRDSTDKYGKLRQIAAGGLYDKRKEGEAQTHRVLHDTKSARVASIVAELGGAPVVVIYNFQFELLLLRSALRGLRIAELNGDTPTNKKAAIEDTWNRGDYDILLLQPKSASHGLNLQHGGSHMIWVTLDDSAERYAQVNKRLSRIGTTKPVIIYRLIAKGTVERGVVVGRLKNKERNQDTLIQYCESLQNSDNREDDPRHSHNESDELPE